jgi:hypothetical protein
MSLEPHPTDLGAQFSEFEHGELDRRLRHLDWPGPPAEVKQRCLDQILGAMRTQAVPTPVPQVPQAPRGSVGQARRYELTRWRPLARSTGWSAPRRQPRFAATL